MDSKRNWIETAFETEPHRVFQGLAAAMKRDVQTFQECQTYAHERRVRFAEQDVKFIPDENTDRFRVIISFPQYARSSIIEFEVYFSGNDLLLSRPISERKGEYEQISITAHISDNGDLFYKIGEEKFDKLWQVSQQILRPAFFPSS